MAFSIILSACLAVTTAVLLISCCRLSNSITKIERNFKQKEFEHLETVSQLMREPFHRIAIEKSNYAYHVYGYKHYGLEVVDGEIKRGAKELSIKIATYHYKYDDSDAEIYARNCAEELVEKFNE